MVEMVAMVTVEMVEMVELVAMVAEVKMVTVPIPGLFSACCDQLSQSALPQPVLPQS